MDLEVSGTKATKRQMSISAVVEVITLVGFAVVPLIAKVTPHHMPSSYLIQEYWLPRKCTVQVVLLASFYMMIHILSGLSVPL